VRLYCAIILWNIGSLIFPSDNYTKLTHLTYKSFQQSSLINIHIAFYNSDPSFGVQWWASDNLQLSGMMHKKSINSLSLYHNISLGYYNQNIKWINSSSNLFEISLHKLKYPHSHSRWINYAYKSRYNYKNFIVGYDLNYYFWGDMDNKFLSLIINYNMKNKIILELKYDIDNNTNFSSFNFSIPL